MHLLPLNRKRKPGAVLPAGLHVFPPTQREPSAGCGTPASSSARHRWYPMNLAVRPLFARARSFLVYQARRRIATRRRRPGLFYVLFSFFMFSFLSGERKENQKRKPGTRLGWPAAPARQRRLPSPQKIFCGAFLSEKPRREKWITDEGGGQPNRRETDDRRGPPAGLRSSPSPLRFLFFGSFFFFGKRKERTEKIKGKKESTLRQPRRMRGRFQR